MYIMDKKNFKLIGTVVVELLWSPIWKIWFREKRDTKTLDTTHGHATRLRRDVHSIFISSNFSLKFSPDIPKTTSVKKTQKSKNRFFLPF